MTKTTDDRPRIVPHPEVAQIHGLDAAIIHELEESMAEAFDSGVLRRAQLRTAVDVLHETLRGGPIMEYLGAVRKEAVEAIAKLPDLDPSNTAAVIKVQLAIDRVAHLIAWLEEYISVSPRQTVVDSDEPPEDI